MKSQLTIYVYSLRNIDQLVYRPKASSQVVLINNPQSIKYSNNSLLLHLIEIRYLRMEDFSLSVPVVVRRSTNALERLINNLGHQIVGSIY